MSTRLNNQKIYEKLKGQEYRPTFNPLKYLLGIKWNMMDFMHTATAQGIITDNIIQRLKSARKTSTNTILWIQFTMDCLLSIIYEHIWKLRCNAAIRKHPKPAKIKKR